jgi:hypothetical protein
MTPFKTAGNEESPPLSPAVSTAMPVSFANSRRVAYVDPL